MWLTRGTFPILLNFLNLYSVIKATKKNCGRFLDDSDLGGINEEKDHKMKTDNPDDFKESSIRNGTKLKCKVIPLRTHNQNICSEQLERNCWGRVGQKYISHNTEKSPQKMEQRKNNWNLYPFSAFPANSTEMNK